MAELPYKITICPDGPEPKKWTAATPQILYMFSVGSKDMTINQEVREMWLQKNMGPTIEEKLEMLTKGRKL